MLVLACVSTASAQRTHHDDVHEGVREDGPPGVAVGRGGLDEPLHREDAEVVVDVQRDELLPLVARDDEDGVGEVQQLAHVEDPVDARHARLVLAAPAVARAEGRQRVGRVVVRVEDDEQHVHAHGAAHEHLHRVVEHHERLERVARQLGASRGPRPRRRRRRRGVGRRRARRRRGLLGGGARAERGARKVAVGHDARVDRAPEQHGVELEQRPLRRDALAERGARDLRVGPQRHLHAHLAQRRAQRVERREGRVEHAAAHGGARWGRDREIRVCG